MNEALGLIDVLESTLLDAKKIPMSQKIILDEKQILQMIDKLRIAIKSDGGAARKAIDRTLQSEDVSFLKDSDDSVNQHNIVQKAKKKADFIKDSANEYADNTMANLELMVARMQKNIFQLERTLKSSREIIDSQREIKQN